MHDWTGMSSVLQDIIDLAKRRNFRLVNMDECLGNSPVSSQVPWEYNISNESNNQNDQTTDDINVLDFNHNQNNGITTRRPSGDFSQWGGWNDWHNWNWEQWHNNKMNTNQ